MRSRLSCLALTLTQQGDDAQWAGTLKPAKRKKYREAVQNFHRYISTNVVIGEVYENYDDAMCAYLTSLGPSGKERQKENLTSAGLKHFLPGRRLPKVSKALKALATYASSKPWPLIPEAVVILLIATSLRRE